MDDDRWKHETFWETCKRDWRENEREILFDISWILTLAYWVFIGF